MTFYIIMLTIDKRDWLCEKRSYSLANYMYSTIHNLTCEYDTSMKCGHCVLLT